MQANIDIEICPSIYNYEEIEMNWNCNIWEPDITYDLGGQSPLNGALKSY